MTHPIMVLQGPLVAALRADSELAALAPVFDAPPKGAAAPYVTIARHDLLPRDGDETPGNEHRLIFHVWAADASRKAVVAIAERVAAVALAAELDGEVVVTLRRHDRTDTAIDQNTGRARAAIALTFYSEPIS
jgi:uncharacterized protein DUF3168